MRGILRLVGIVAVAGFLTGCQKTQVSEVPRTVAVLQVGWEPHAADDFRFTGQIVARRELRIGFRVGGKITDRLVEVGQYVQAGEVLARLDRSDYELTLEAAKADVEAAQAANVQAVADEKRVSDLAKRNMISQTEVDAALSAKESTGAQLRRARRLFDLAENRLRYCELQAEFPSIVLEVHSEVGSIVQDGTPVFQLARTDEVEAVIAIPENKLSLLNHNQATIQLWANEEITYQAQLREVSPNTDPLTRTFRARFSIANPTDAIRLGMTAIVQLQPDNVANKLMLPMSALIMERDRYSVWVLNETQQHVRKRSVEIAKYGDGDVEILSGLEPGEWIVRAGVQLLDEQQPIRPWFGSMASASTSRR